MRRNFWIVALVLVLVGVAVLSRLPGWAEDRINVVLPHEPWDVSAEARALHERLTLADLHADTLLWARDPLERADRGHVDVPRLQAGGFGLQLFFVVTKSPRGQNYERNSADSDMLTLLTILQRWPRDTWSSLRARAFYQARKLHDAAARAQGDLRVVRNAAELDEVLAARRSGAKTVAGVLGLEGAHALEGELGAVAELRAAGFRVVGLHHFFDNELGGSLHGISRGGLTEFGRAVVGELERQGMLVDLAHSSPAVVDEVLEIATRPVIVSHTGVYGACQSPRNLDDARMKRIAARGGLIGIGYWDGAVCDVSPAGVVRALRHAVDLIGLEHVALGSDWDGGTQVSFDASEMAVLTHELLGAGFSPSQIEAVMGGNALRFFRENLPRSGS